MSFVTTHDLTGDSPKPKKPRKDWGGREQVQSPLKAASASDQIRACKEYMTRNPNTKCGSEAGILEGSDPYSLRAFGGMQTLEEISNICQSKGDMHGMLGLQFNAAFPDAKPPQEIHMCKLLNPIKDTLEFKFDNGIEPISHFLTLRSDTKLRARIMDRFVRILNAASSTQDSIQIIAWTNEAIVGKLLGDFTNACQTTQFNIPDTKVVDLTMRAIADTFEYQCFPLSQSDHWVLGFYVSSAKTLISFDSSCPGIPSVTRQLGKILESCLEEKIKLVEGKCPLQHDSVSCGIFVARNMDFLFRKAFDKSLGQASGQAIDYPDEIKATNSFRLYMLYWIMACAPRWSEAVSRTHAKPSATQVIDLSTNLLPDTIAVAPNTNDLSNNKTKSTTGWNKKRFRKDGVGTHDDPFTNSKGDLLSYIADWHDPSIHWDASNGMVDEPHILQLGDTFLVKGAILHCVGFDHLYGLVMVKDTATDERMCVAYHTLSNLKDVRVFSCSTPERGPKRIGHMHLSSNLIPNPRNGDSVPWATKGKVYPLQAGFSPKNMFQVDTHSEGVLKSVVECPLCNRRVEVNGPSESYEFRTVTFPSDVPVNILNALKSHGKSCPHGPLWFVCNRISKPPPGEGLNPVQYAQYRLQRAITQVGGIPFPAFANTPEGLRLFHLRITALFTYAIHVVMPRNTLSKEYFMSDEFDCYATNMLNMLYMSFMHFDVGAWVENRIRNTGVGRKQNEHYVESTLGCSAFHAYNHVNRWFSDGGLYWRHQLPPTVTKEDIWNAFNAQNEPLLAQPKPKTKRLAQSRKKQQSI